MPGQAADLERTRGRFHRNPQDKLVNKSGIFKLLIISLTGKETYTQSGQVRDIWNTGLSSYGLVGDKLTGLGLCIDATNEAIGTMESNIKHGIRDKKGNLIEGTNNVDTEEDLSPETIAAKADWKAIENAFGISKNHFGRKINFVSDSYQRSVIFRDVEQAFILASSGFSKPAVILAGGVIEELLRLYLKKQGISPQKPLRNDFNGYIQTCEQKGLLAAGISRLSDSVRHFRNLVHLPNEKAKKHTISKSIAIGAVASIFTIADDF